MRRKITLFLLVVTLLALSVPTMGLAGPVEDLTHEVECVRMMAYNECPGCMTVWEKIKCVRECVKHKLEGKPTCPTHGG